MKIGLLTLGLRTNYGGNLQAYALMTVLRSLGHQVWLIDYRKKLTKRQRIWRTALSSVLRLRSARRAPSARTSLKARPYSPIHWFTDQRIQPQTEIFFSPAELAQRLPGYALDAIVIGSDQVWRPSYTSNIADYFFAFLPEGDIQTRRIVYAASFGTTQWELTPEQTLRCAGLIRRADALSVREDSAVELCRTMLGTNAAIHIVDPTLLLEPEHYRQLSLAPESTRGVENAQCTGLLTYMLDMNQDKEALVKRVAGHLNLPTTSAKWSEWRILGSVLAGDPASQTMEGWINSFIRAKFVVTDSFHGCVLSILFNRPFIAVGNEARGMARFTSLLRMFSLEDRLVSAPYDEAVERLSAPIAWERVNEILSHQRALALNFLILALQAPGPREEADLQALRIPAKPCDALVP
jgi:polysaccharide pyruvyl transferase WcaK-like protein